MMQNKFSHLLKYFSNLRYFDLIFGSIILVILCLFCYSYAFSLSNNINFYPLNGDFQNYNILRRLKDGQFFAADFNSYLGLGTMLFVYAFYLFDGSNGLSSSIFASYFSTQIIFIISCLVFLKLFKIKFFIASLVVFVLYFLSIKINSEFILPGNSMYIVRMALPYLTVLAYLFILPEDLILTIKQKILFSIISGISLLWSNDYSIPTYMTSTALFILITIQTSLIKTKDIFLYLILSLFTFFCILLTLTNFSSLEWLKYNFIGIASDQYWYYQGDVIFGFSQLPSKVFITLEVLFALYLLLEKDKSRYLIAFVILASIASAYLTQIGGHLSDRYFNQSYLLLYLITIGVVFHFLKIHQVKLINILDHRIAIIFTITILTIFIISTIIIKGFYKTKSGFYFESYYGTYLNNNYRNAVDIALRLKEESKHLTKDKKIFSEYSTLMDDIVGGFQPSGNDYIIHAMGEAEKKKYLSSFKELDPMFITTIRDDFTHWALWSKRVNWYFFRELFASNYVPKYFTHYNIVWKRDPNFQSIKPLELDCKIKKISENETILVFENSISNKNFVADVEINHNIKFTKSIVPIIGNRFLIKVQDLFQDNKYLFKTRSNYSISPYNNNANLMLEHKSSDIINILKISTVPDNRTQLNIKSCSAKIIRFYNENEEINKLIKDTSE